MIVGTFVLAAGMSASPTRPRRRDLNPEDRAGRERHAVDEPFREELVGDSLKVSMR